MIWCRLHKDVVDSGDLVQASQGRRIVDSCDWCRLHKDVVS